jgi:hypothetical protein
MRLTDFLRPAAIGLTGALLAAGGALAGPPYVTDDPEPTDQGHWEVYNYVSAVRVPGDTAGQAGIDMNYGGAKDLQLTAVIPMDFDSVQGSGVGAVQLAAKYKFLHQSDGSLTPDVSFFPRFFLPTASRQFGPQRLGLLLPIWAEKDFGPWSVFGGGGYDINPGPGNRNYWQDGVVVTYAFSDRFNLGAEIYNQSPDTLAAKPFTGLNLGAIYKLSERWQLLASGGPGVQNPREGGQYDLYVALELTY